MFDFLPGKLKNQKVFQNILIGVLSRNYVFNNYKQNKKLKIHKFTCKKKPKLLTTKNNKKKSKTDGTIDFINGNKMFLSDSIYNHQPKEGDVILFPNYLMHTAYPFNSSGERRSFSFNLEIDSKIANVFSR